MSNRRHRAPPLSKAIRRVLIRSVLTGCLVATSFAVAGCGGSGSPSRSAGSPRSLTVLNTKKIARAIERSSLAQRGEHADVHCPASVHQQKGVVFSCTAVVGRYRTPFVVTELDGSGEVHYQAR
jgi:hypothetical protein